MKNLKVGMKLLVSFLLVIAVFVAAIAVGIFSMDSIKVALNNYYEHPYVVKDAATVAKSQFERQQKYIFRSLSTTDMAVTNESVENARQCANEIDTLVASIENLFLGDPQLVDNLKSAIAQIKPMQEQALLLAANNANVQASQYMEETVVPAINQANAAFDALIAASNNTSEEMIANTNSAQILTVILLLAMALAGIIVSLLLCLNITRGIVSPLKQIRTAASALAHGNLKVSVDYHSKDELGEVSQDIRDMASMLSAYITDITNGMTQIAKGNLNVAPTVEFEGDFILLRDSIIAVLLSLDNTLGNINRSADQVASGSSQVSSGAQALSQGATEQASAVQELAATINEISVKVENTAGNAQQASAKANDVGHSMAQSNEQMQEMITAMSEISDSSSQIGRIIKTIEDIAFQTNILALNAAVEAARAGNAGKGFAVVADEVRNLASKSAAASKDTAALIEGSIQAVENGTRIADGTAQSLLKAVEGAQEVTRIVDKISAAADEQARSISQITQGIDQISAVVQTNSATAEESAAASEELSSQADLLKNMVSKFVLRDETSAKLPNKGIGGTDAQIALHS